MCARIHGRVCLFEQHQHADLNREVDHRGRLVPWYNCQVFQRLQSLEQPLDKLPYRKKLAELGQKGSNRWILVDTTSGPEHPSKRNVSDEFDCPNIDDIIYLPHARYDETIDLHTLFSEHTANVRRLKGHNAKCKPREQIILPHTTLRDKQTSLLLDSGCIGRDFIYSDVVDAFKLIKYPLLYPIEVNSIHGTEVATEVVLQPNLKIIYEGQTLILPKDRLVVLNNNRQAPAAIILGPETL